MTAAIQAVSSAYTASLPPALIPILQRAQQANPSLFDPSVIVTLGAPASAPLTYNADGLYEPLLRIANTPQDASGSAPTQVLAALLGQDFPPATASSANLLHGLPPDQAISTLNSQLPTNFALGITASLVSSDTAATAKPQLTTAAVSEAIPTTPTVAATPPTTLAARPVIAATNAAMNTATVSTGTPPVTTVAGSTRGTSAPALPMANSFLRDDVARALKTISSDPAYASAAAGLYLRVAILRSQQMSEDMLNSSSRVQPVTALPAVTPVQAVRR